MSTKHPDSHRTQRALELVVTETSRQIWTQLMPAVPRGHDEKSLGVGQKWQDLIYVTWLSVLIYGNWTGGTNHVYL